jgi:hypothetical protein
MNTLSNQFSDLGLSIIVTFPYLPIILLFHDSQAFSSPIPTEESSELGKFTKSV